VRTEGPRLERFRFGGNATEYFGIWIVNLFLTVITLGIYSAWAKVRRKRYFYGNTWLADSNFEYHGNPVAILKGRIIAFVAFVAYSLTTQYSPKLGGLLLAAGARGAVDRRALVRVQRGELELPQPALPFRRDLP
jgi:uncharacterized membrane protein YjgN (DUF898 family)